jgi:hypothetical protein
MVRISGRVSNSRSNPFCEVMREMMPISGVPAGAGRFIQSSSEVLLAALPARSSRV